MQKKEINWFNMDRIAKWFVETHFPFNFPCPVTFSCRLTVQSMWNQFYLVSSDRVRLQRKFKHYNAFSDAILYENNKICLNGTCPQQTEVMLIVLMVLSL